MGKENYILASYIVPHPPLAISEIGRGEEKKIQRTLDAYDNISQEISMLKPETIVFISPHSVMYSDYIHISPGSSAKGDFSSFGVKEVEFKTNYDTELVDEIIKTCTFSEFPAGTLGEREPNLDHGVMVPMNFINKRYNNYKSVRIGISGISFIDHYTFGMIIESSIKKLKRSTVIIASGDLSHKLLSTGPYGFSKDGKIFDDKICEIIKTGRFQDFFDFTDDFCDSAGECGLRSFIIMAGIMNGKSIKNKLLSYEGPFGVGYAVGSFKIVGEDEARLFRKEYNNNMEYKIFERRKNESPYVRLARKTLEEYITNSRILKVPSDLPEELLNSQAGVFVSIKKDGKLRGCIGTISPTEDNIALEIIQNAISSGTRDPRFSPIQYDELESLEYSVDILSPPEPIDSKDKLNVDEYGVIVSKGKRRGLLLPNLEGINSVDEQISIALRKASISDEESYKMERFKVERYL